VGDCKGDSSVTSLETTTYRYSARTNPVGTKPVETKPIESKRQTPGYVYRSSSQSHQEGETLCRCPEHWQQLRLHCPWRYGNGHLRTAKQGLRHAQVTAKSIGDSLGTTERPESPKGTKAKHSPTSLAGGVRNRDEPITVREEIADSRSFFSAQPTSARSRRVRSEHVGRL
jgi:hypothetical protein